MISIDQRIYIVFIGLVVFLFQTIHYLVKQPSVQIRIAKFLQMIVILFPILDLKLPPADLNFKLFDVAILVFVLLNLTSLLNYFKRYLTKFTLFFLGIMFLLAVFSEFPVNSLLFDFRLILLAILLMLIRIVVEHGYDVYTKVLIPVFIWALVFFVLQIIFGLDFSLYQNSNEASLRDLRYTSFAQDPQKMAQLVFMLAIIFLARLFQQQKFSSLRDWLIIVLCVIIGLATGARAGLLGFVIAFAFLYLNRVSVKSVFYLILFGVTGWLMFEWIMTFQTFQRMNELNDALQGRMEIFWLRALAIFNDNMLFGVGPGSFANYVTVHHSDFTYGINGPIVDQPESGYLLWLCETGIIGTICYVLTIIFIMARNTQSNKARPFKLALIVWLVGFITIYSLSDIKVLFIVVLCIAMIFASKQTKPVLK